MSEPDLNTATETYATAPTVDLDRFDTAFKQQKPRQSENVCSGLLLAGVATTAIMMVTVSAGGAATATPTPNWSASTDCVVVSGPVDRKAVLCSRLNAFRHLPNYWDGAGGHPPTPEAVDEGLAFLDLLPPSTPLPDPFPAGDGEVGFHWKTADDFAEVSFYGDGHIYFYARVGRDGIEVDGAEPYTGRSIPKALARALAEI